VFVGVLAALACLSLRHVSEFLYFSCHGNRGGGPRAQNARQGGSLGIGLQPVRVGQAGGAPLLQVLRHQAGMDQLVAQIVSQGARIALIV
jgi:hypothetical protein